MRRRILSYSRAICLVLPSIYSHSLSAEPESWYMFWSVGVSDHQHDADVKAFVDNAEQQPGTFTHSEIASDAFGFYIPVMDNTLFGVVLSGSSDIISRADTNEPDNLAELFTEFPYISSVSDYLTVRQTLYAASAMRFYGDEPGDGFFLRGDLGIARLVVTTELSSPIKDSTGAGVLVGAGYGFPVSDETRILLSITYSYNEIDGHSYQAAAFRVSGLW